MIPEPGTSLVPPRAKRVSPSVRYVEHFNPLNNFILPRAPIGTFWEGKTRIPESLEKRVSGASLFVQHGLTQYRGSLSATAIASAGSLYAARRKQSFPRFKIKTPSLLQRCFKLVHYTMPDGKSLVLKDTAENHTSLSKPVDHKLRAKSNGGKSIPNGTRDELNFEASAFDRLDKRIDIIVQQILPDIPHLVSVPTKTPYVREFPNENLNTPFEDWEVQKLQHMTLVSNGSRGVAWVKGNWLEEYNTASPYSGFRSGTATPRSEREGHKIRTKMSLAEYKAGNRPTSSSQTARLAVPQIAPNGQTSASKDPESPTQQMIDQIIEKSASKLVPRYNEKYINDIARPTQPDPPHISDASHPQPLPKPQKQAEEGRAVWPPSNKPDWKQTQHQEEPSEQRAKPKRSDYTSIPSDPQHPSNQQNRQELEQKRQKPELKQSAKKGALKQPPSNSANGPLSREPRAPKMAPANLGKADLVARPSSGSQEINDHNLATPAGVSTPLKQSKVSGTTSLNKHLDNGKPASIEVSIPDSINTMPPLLSPLPAGLLSPDRPGLEDDAVSHSSKPNQITPPSSTKSKTAYAAPAEQAHHDVASPSESPLEMPPLLSPLPEWWMEKIGVDAETLRLHDSEIHATTIATLGARRERSRQPDTPGVARKTTKLNKAKSTVAKDVSADPSSSISAKVGENTDGLNKKLDSNRADRDRLLVKLKYGKRNSKAITRLLQMTARPVAEAKILPVSAHAPAGSEARKLVRTCDDTEEPSTKRNKVANHDASLPTPSGTDNRKHARLFDDAEQPSAKRPKVANKDRPAPNSSESEAKKHARPADDAEEPSTKRPKVTSSVDAQRARTPLTPSAQSPAPSMAQKTFTTPKKGDAMKSVAMRRVDSNDGQVHTPHGGSVSTPASTEKPRTSGGDSKYAELDALKAAHTKYTAIGTMLKRQADQILKIKEKDAGPVSGEERRLGAVIAIESVIAYMVGFHSGDLSRQKERKFGHAEQWSQFLPFMVFATERAKGHDELFTLALLLNAVSRECLERIYMDRLPAEPAGTVPGYLKELAKNSHLRQSAWSAYRDQCKEHPVEFTISVEEAKGVAVTVLAEYCKKMSIAWETKLEL